MFQDDVRSMSDNLSEIVKLCRIEDETQVQSPFINVCLSYSKTCSVRLFVCFVVTKHHGEFENQCNLPFLKVALTTN